MNIDSEIKINESVSDDISIAVDNESYTKDFEYGLICGCGLNLSDLSSLEIRYNYGFSTVDDSPSKEDIHNSVIQLLFGYKFK